MDSPFTPFTPEQNQKINAGIDTIYDGFIGIVANGRKIPAGTVAGSAKGRVWSGQQAKQLGLVDSLGGLDDAIKLARDVAGIPADQPSVIRIYPEPLSTRSRRLGRVAGRRRHSERCRRRADRARRSGGHGGARPGALVQGPQGDMVRMPELGRYATALARRLAVRPKT